MPTTLAPKASDTTRTKLLWAAFAEFYRNGFQGGSLNQIVEAAGSTKGAIFHHFAGKQELGYAVMDGIIEPLILERWLTPLASTTDPVADIKASFRRFVREDIESGAWVHGCPLNNLALEMSALDSGFRSRIDKVYTTWRRGFATALADGVTTGTVRANLSPRSAAALLVAGQMGIWGTGKNSQNKTVMMQATDAMCDYLDSLKA